LSGVLSPTSQAYCSVPPEPLADKLTVAVVFAEAGLLNVTLEVVGAVVLVIVSKLTASQVPLLEKGEEEIDHLHLSIPVLMSCV
jgi:hypothetical protein